MPHHDRPHFRPNERKLLDSEQPLHGKPRRPDERKRDDRRGEHPHAARHDERQPAEDARDESSKER